MLDVGESASELLKDRDIVKSAALCEMCGGKGDLRIACQTRDGAVWQLDRGPALGIGFDRVPGLDDSPGRAAEERAPGMREGDGRLVDRKRPCGVGCGLRRAVE